MICVTARCELNDGNITDVSTGGDDIAGRQPVTPVIEPMFLRRSGRPRHLRRGHVADIAACLKMAGDIDVVDWIEPMLVPALTMNAVGEAIGGDIADA